MGLINKQSAEKVARESRETGERQAASSSSSRKRQPKATATATAAAIGYMIKAGFVCVAWCVAVGCWLVVAGGAVILEEISQEGAEVGGDVNRDAIVNRRCRF